MQSDVNVPTRLFSVARRSAADLQLREQDPKQLRGRF